MDFLEASLSALCEAFPYRAAYHFRDLENGQLFQRNADSLYNAASLRKLSILTAALAAVQAGRVSLSQPLVVGKNDQNHDSGCLQHLTPGLTLTFRDALILMIIISDSSAAGLVVNLLGLEAVNDYCRRVGLLKTCHRFGLTPADYSPESPKNLTTAAETGFLLENLVQGSEVSAAAQRWGLSQTLCGLALGILSWQKIRNRLPALLPPGTRVAHKTGLDFGCVHDAGVIYEGDRPRFILTVLLDRVPLETAEGIPGAAPAMILIARLARSAFDALIRAKVTA